ncbi:MAG: hypothetical protein ACI9MR_003302 [Myxococcota bacterium]|jgi:hypothetical protein
MNCVCCKTAASDVDFSSRRGNLCPTCFQRRVINWWPGMYLVLGLVLTSIGLYAFEASIGFDKYADAYMLGSVLHHGLYFLTVGVHMYAWNRWRGWTPIRICLVIGLAIAGVTVCVEGVQELVLWPEVS